RAATEARARENQEIRRMLATERAATDAAGEASRRLAREIAGAEGGRAAAERQGREARERHTALASEVDRLTNELAQMTDQTELWATEAEDARAKISAAISACDALAEELTVLRGR